DRRGVHAAGQPRAQQRGDDGNGGNTGRAECHGSPLGVRSVIGGHCAVLAGTAGGSAAVGTKLPLAGACGGAGWAGTVVTGGAGGMPGVGALTGALAGALTGTGDGNCGWPSILPLIKTSPGVGGPNESVGIG